ncbi:MAG: T9SS type A sorting domain-containing protein [bacterium]|nr:T9SS type A sorting domain-containing protein [bacterium]
MLPLLIAFVFLAKAQKPSNNWYFGVGAGLNFAAPNPTLLAGGAITTSAGCSSISDSTGNLLFYTDGVTVYDKTNSLMANGSGLLGNNAAQSSMIIKQPGNFNLYYIFTVQGTGTAGFNYSIVDMNLAAGNGSVTVKNASLMTGAFAPKLTATKHCNGIDYWVLANYNNFYACLLTATGISTIVTSVGFPFSNQESDCMKLSPNGRRLAFFSHSFAMFNNCLRAYLLGFNPATGAVSGLTTIIYNCNNVNTAGMSPPPYGCEFSPDGTKLYFALAGQLWQLELTTFVPYAGWWQGGSLIGSGEQYVLEGATKGSMQLASNGKIYIAVPGTNSLGVINNPNALGNACAYNVAGQSLGTVTCQWGLPNFPSSYFEKTSDALFTFSLAATSCNTYSFFTPASYTVAGYNIISMQWNFGDPLSLSSNTSTLSNPTHSFSSVGNFTTQLILQFDCGKIDTLIKIIPVTSPTLNIICPLKNCNSATASVVTIGGTGSYSYTWSPGSQTTSVVNNLSAGIYSVSMIDNGGGCSRTQTISISVTTLIALVSSQNPLCFGSSSGTVGINISGGSGLFSYTWSPGFQSTPTLGGLSQGTYSVTGFDLVNLCSITRSVALSQPPPITLTAIALSPTACATRKFVLAAGAAGGTLPYVYAWSGGANSSFAVDTVVQSVSGVYFYTVTVSDLNNCNASNIVSVSIISNPQLVVPNVTVCPLQIANMVASGATNYTWQPGSYFTSNFTLIPVSNQVFTINGSAFGCFTQTTTSVFINPSPTVSIGANSPLCEGQVLNLNASSGSTFSWQGPLGYSSSLQSPAFTASVLNAGTYSLIMTAQNSCTVSSSVSVSVNPRPALLVTGNFTICPGKQTLLIPSGAMSYSWSTGATVSLIYVSPSVTTTYSLTGTDNASGCSSSATVIVLVKPSPTITLQGKTEICFGESIILTGQGANTYTWNTGINSSTIVISTPITTTMYVIGTNTNNSCTSKVAFSILVNECTAIANNVVEGKFSIYPNPGSGIFRVLSEEAISIEIYNEFNQFLIIESHPIGSSILDLRNFANGVYLLKCSSKSKIFIFKLIKIE